MTRLLPNNPELADALRRLAALPPADYQTCRKQEAKRLGLKLSALDALVRKAQGSSAEAEGVRAQRDHLLDLIAGAEFWRDPSDDGFATVVEDGARKTIRVRSDAFRNYLIRLWMKYFDSQSGLISVPGSQALQDAVAAVEAKAQQGPVHTPYVRIGHAGGNIYVDLGDDSWSAVEITKTGWWIVDESPVRFVRPKVLMPLPHPVLRENGYTFLLSILPDGTDAKDARVLLLSFLVGVFMPEGSLPVLVLAGLQGSGKTTLTRRMRALIDPNRAPARQPPRSEDDLIIAANNGALVCFDNLSRIDQTLSDALCRLATGSSFSKRRLYTDADEVIIQVRRPVVINGITDLVRMPDLADRALFIELPTRSALLPEAELEQAFEHDRRAMLGRAA